MREIVSTPMEGVFIINPFVLEDNRGAFVKTFHYEKFKEQGFVTHFQESYYSNSTKDVIRGMHFQLPPHDHEKLVYVTSGEILDVVVDLRKNSQSFGQYYSVKLAAFGSSLYISKGLAHGFLTLSKTATVVYNVSTVYCPASDTGIRWDSFGFDWGTNTPIISERDKGFSTLQNFSPYF